MRGDDTKDRIKFAARRLFAERGIDGVSIREIVAAAGQRNVGSLHYYFRTKEALIRELIVDGARLINDRRNVMLDVLERRGGPQRLREIIDVLIMPAAGPEGMPEDEETYFRFLIMLQLNHRKLFTGALGSQWNSGYDRCVVHIRRLLANVPSALLDQRLLFVTVYLSTMLAARESAVGGSGGRHRFWSKGYTMSNLADTAQALLECEMSAETAAALPSGSFAKRGKVAALKVAEAK
ncbi:MAG TPA: helix-turn-helix domain-containing protein [Parvibaculum sp.]|jgi:AcrR family transcriptional regulator